MINDTRYVYGATCTWHGPISEASSGDPDLPSGLPCCPNCGGVLFELPSRAKWDEDVDKYIKDAIHEDLCLYYDWMETFHSDSCRPLDRWNWRADFKKWKVERFEREI